MADFEYCVKSVDEFGLAEGGPIEAAVETAINRIARDGWEFMRIDTVTSGDPQRIWAERKSVMIFRRARAPKAQAVSPQSASPLVLTQPIFVNRQTGDAIEIPHVADHARPTIETAVRAARDRQAEAQHQVPDNAPIPLQRSSGGRLFWRSS